MSQPDALHSSRRFARRWRIGIAALAFGAGGGCTASNPQGHRPDSRVEALDSLTYRLRVEMTPYSQEQSATDFFLRRAGEVCRARGFGRFVVVDTTHISRTSLRPTGLSSGEAAGTTGLTGRIRCDPATGPAGDVPPVPY